MRSSSSSAQASSAGSKLRRARLRCLEAEDELEVRSNDRESTHQKLASHLASHRRDLILTETGLHQVGDEQLQPVGRTRITSLTKIRREDEVLRADLLHCRSGLLDFHSAPVPHPFQMRLRTHQYTHRTQFELGAHRRGLLHLLEAHIDNLELSMSDNHAVHAGIAASLDDSKRLGWR